MDTTERLSLSQNTYELYSPGQSGTELNAVAGISGVGVLGKWMHPTSTFRGVPPASIFCFTSSFFKVQWLLSIGCAIMCPCADYREGLEGSA